MGGCAQGVWPHVFPACAGMFRRHKRRHQHASGFSPRARGCSSVACNAHPHPTVFPACAGMFLMFRWPGRGCRRFPRVRGDVPSPGHGVFDLSKFSPRARGCSAFDPSRVAQWTVFPACAGMFRLSRISAQPAHRFPRVRGDVPFDFWLVTWRLQFSPRARGCSPVTPTQAFDTKVFPACAGMFLNNHIGHMTIARFPRVRGDVPPTTLCRKPVKRFSPRARGCSGVLSAMPVVV